MVLLCRNNATIKLACYCGSYFLNNSLKKLTDFNAFRCVKYRGNFTSTTYRHRFAHLTYKL